MNILNDKKGGRGKCQYCNKWHNNVSYHEELECDKRPWLKEVLDSAGGCYPIKIQNGIVRFLIIDFIKKSVIIISRSLKMVE